MDIKEELQKLYPGSKIFGPYIHKKNERVFYVRSLPAAFGKRKKTTILKSRALMEIELGRILSSEEEVDHIDGDKKNDVIENLRVVSKAENARLAAERRIIRSITFQCPVCNVMFQREPSRLKEGRAYFACSNRCSSLYRMQNNKEWERATLRVRTSRR